MIQNHFIICKGLPKSYRSSAAFLYNQAFGQKFSVAIKSEQQRLELFESCFLEKYAFLAFAEKQLIGIIGFHTFEGSLTGGITYNHLISHLGFFRGSWAALILSLYERKPKPGELLLDGISVHSDFRGKGVGSKLLDKIIKYAEENQYFSIRLDVIDTNPKAKKLYGRKGFQEIKTEKFPYLKWLLGFSSSTTMQFTIK